MTQPIRFALVGSGHTAHNLLQHIQALRQFEGNSPFICVALVENASEKEKYGVRVYTHIEDVIAADNVDVVVDTSAGISAAYNACWAALNAGKPVVTTHAAMVSIYGEKLEKVACAHHVSFVYDNAVLGAVPILKSIENGARQWYITRVYGVLNSTCNYVLKRMHDRHLPLEKALSDAVELGYAHENVDIDINGKGTAYQLALVAQKAFGKWYDLDDATITPLDDISVNDIQTAHAMGYRLCHLAIATENGLSVGPTLVEQHTLVAQLEGSLTGVVVDGEQVGSLFFAGYGADEKAHVSSILQDIQTAKMPTQTISYISTAKRQHKKRYQQRFYVKLAEHDRGLMVSHPSLDIVESVLIKEHNQLAMIVETSIPKKALVALLEDTPYSLVLDIFRA